MNIKVGFIGFGRMGSALANGCISAHVLKSSQIVGFDPSARAATQMKKSRVKVAKSTIEVVEKSQLIFLALKPQVVRSVCAELKESCGRTLRKKVFVSIAAGVGVKTLERGLGNHVPVLRVMPNTPAYLQTGMAAISRGRHATAMHRSWVKTIMDSVGKAVFVNENKMDGVTALSGSGPAYVFYLAESMMSAAQKLGFQKSLAKELVNQTLLGASRMLDTQAESAAELRKQVTSPGGTTEAAIKEFESKGMKKIIEKAIQKATARSRELSK